MKYSVVFLFLVILVFIAPGGISAQTGGFSQGLLVTLSQSPEAPSPNSLVTFTLTSGHIDLSKATISWYVDGTLSKSSIGGKLFSTLSGQSGKQRSIRATITSFDGTTTSANATLRPGEVYILWEASSYTPPFFKGRSLASPGSTIRIHADSTLYSAQGTKLGENSTNYTWSVNGREVRGLSGFGKSNIIIASPPKYGKTIVKVVARDSKNTTSGSASVRIDAQEPILALYASNPIEGTIYRNTLRSTDSVRADLSTLVAEPYYIPSTASPSYNWLVNGEVVNPSPVAPNRITLSPEGAKEIVARVALALKNQSLTSIAQAVWNITVIGSTSDTPFGSTQ